MKRRTILQALTVSAFSLVLFFAGCTTVETRIQERPEAFHQLSPNDKSLVQQGRIREGMSQDAVYIAWGAPSARVPGRNRGHTVETWIYDETAAGDYPGPSYGFGYGGYGYGGYGGGFGYSGRHGRFFGGGGLYYDPFYDPFFYNSANIIRYPDRTVSFQNGRVISFQFLPPPRYY